MSGKDDEALIAGLVIVVAAGMFLAPRADEVKDAAGQAWDRVAAEAGEFRRSLPGYREPVAVPADLAGVPVEDVDVPGYARAAFGPSWKDVDRNGCDTRNDVLARDLTAVAYRVGSDCVVVAGTLRDPYTGDTVEFVKADAGDVQIDHVVALSYAWDHGAHAWDPGRREVFANDVDNLLATIGAVNASKGDDGPSEWWPPDEAFGCEYARTWTGVVVEYGLSVTAGDRDALAEGLAGCGQPQRRDV